MEEFVLRNVLESEMQNALRDSSEVVRSVSLQVWTKLKGQDGRACNSGFNRTRGKTEFSSSFVDDSELAEGYCEF